MKIIASSIMICLIVISSKGQGTFQVVYPSHNSTAYAQQAPDGNYIVSFRDSLLFKIDSTAQILWSKSVHIGMMNFKIDDQGRIWGGGLAPGLLHYDALMCLWDSTGDSLWTRRFPTTYSGASVIQEKLNPSGTCMFSVIDDVPGLSNSYYMININVNGDSLLHYSTAQTDFSFDGSGQLINLSTNIYSEVFSVSLTDTLGNVFWRSTIEDTIIADGTDVYAGEKVIQCSNGTFLVAGSVDHIPIQQMEAKLFRFDAGTGDTLYSRSYGVGNFVQIIQCANGGFAGIVQNSSLKLCLLDSSLNLLSLHDYPGVGGSAAISLQECADHGFLIGGYTATYPYIIKTDSLGDAPSLVMESIFEGRKKQIDLFPNPFSESTRLNIILNKDTPVAIYNCQGQIVDVQILSHTSPIINGEKLSDGLYFFRLISDSPMSGKMVKVVSN